MHDVTYQKHLNLTCCSISILLVKLTIKTRRNTNESGKDETVS
jgi:hypothetical protein